MSAFLHQNKVAIAWAGAVLALILAAWVSAVFLASAGTTGEKAEAGQPGLLHFEEWDFAADGPLTLDQGWRFSGGGQTRFYRRGETIVLAERVRPPFVTLEAELTLQRAAAGQRLSLETGSFNTHYRLFVNEHLAHDSRAASGGWPGDPGYTSVGTLDALVGRDGRVRLRYQFDVRVDGVLLMDSAPRLGLHGDVAGARGLFTIGLVLLVGAMLFATSYHVVILLVTRDSVSSLAFACFTLVFGLRTIVLEPLAVHVVPFLGPDLLWRANFGLTILLGPTCYWFFVFGFPQHMPRILGYVFTVPCVTGALVCAFGSYDAGYFCLKAFQLLALGMIATILQAIIRSAWAREPGAWLAVLGWLCSALPAIHDIMVDAKIINGTNLLPFGFVAFFLCLSGMLASRFHQAYRRNEVLAADLLQLNEHLEARISERTRELSDRLEELERNRAQLEAARAAAVAASQSKSRFLANMSHELRTPLNAILGFAEIIRERMFGDGAIARYSDYAGSIHKSGTHLLRLINDILDLSKIEAGKFELKTERLDLVNEVEAAIGLVALQAQTKGVALSYAQGLRPMVLADQRALQQIFINLLSNAVKFTPAGGAVIVSAESHSSGALEISVCDTGIGIAPEDMGRVLESFGQAAHDVTTREERGTGLGLPIAKGLVEAHGGALVLESAPGVGTTVRVRLPADRVLRDAVAAVPHRTFVLGSAH